MYIYEPFFLVGSCLQALAAIFNLVIGIVHIRRSKISQWFLGPLCISIALAWAVQSAAIFSRAFDWHYPSVRTLILFAFSGGMIVATALSVGLSMYIVGRLHGWSEKTEARFPVEITRVV